LPSFYMKKTRNGIYYDLNYSEFKFYSEELDLTFVFSSKLHLTKFKEQFLQHRAEFNQKYSVRFKIKCSFKALPDLVLYRRIESRGFLIKEGDTNLCQKFLKLGGEQVIRKD